MRSILEELWYDNISPSEQCHKITESERELMSYIARHHDELYSTLSEKQREIFDKFNDCNNELISIYDRELFVYAFRLGARTAIEVMSFEAE